MVVLGSVCAAMVVLAIAMVVLTVICAVTMVLTVKIVPPLPFSGCWRVIKIGVPHIPCAWVRGVGLVVASVVLVPITVTVHSWSGNEKSGNLRACTTVWHRIT